MPPPADEKPSSALTTIHLAVTSTSISAMGSAAFGGLETREPLTEAQIDGIARGLLAQLTLEEKIGMMSGDTPFFQGMLHLNRNGYFRQPRTTAGAIPRLGIPGVRFSDGPRGFHGEGATTFPQGSARGASWDPNLEERVGDVMGREARAHGSNMIGAPCINLLRHPAWGRAQEGYGEDSFHLGEMGAALVRGIQHSAIPAASKTDPGGTSLIRNSFSLSGAPSPAAAPIAG